MAARVLGEYERTGTLPPSLVDRIYGNRWREGRPLSRGQVESQVRAWADALLERSRQRREWEQA